MSSSRLPGKIMEDICGKPMLHHIVDRTKKIANVDDIVVATTTNKSDDKVAKWAKTNNIKVFRGPEDDVLKRYFDAAQKYKADIIVRICADSPLFDPGLTKEMIGEIIKSDGDFVVLKDNQPSVSCGVNVFSFKALKKAYEKAPTKYQREHVIPYFLETPKGFGYVYAEQVKDFARGDLRLTVDTISDLELIREIYKHLYKEGEIIDLKDVIKFLDKNPSIKKINAHVTSVGPGRPDFKVAILIAANQTIGYGHMFRMLTLAKTLTERFANAVTIVGDVDSLAMRHILKNHCTFVPISRKNLKSLIESYFDCVILDSHVSVLRKIFSEVSNRVLKVNYDDEVGDRLATISFMPLGSKNRKAYQGLRYYILGNLPTIKNGKERQYFLISAGSGDSKNVILKIAKLILNINYNMPLALLIGPFYKHKDKLEIFKKKYPRVKIFDNPDLSKVFSQTKIAVCYFGVTMLEMIASRIICAVYSINYTQKEQTRKLARKGVVFDLGFIDEKNMMKKVTNIVKNRYAQQTIKANISKLANFKGELVISEKIQVNLLSRL